MHELADAYGNLILLRRPGKQTKFSVDTYGAYKNAHNTVLYADTFMTTCKSNIVLCFKHQILNIFASGNQQ